LSDTSSSAPIDATLSTELRSVVAEMLQEMGAGLSPEEVSAEADSRVQEAVGAKRRFYPEFLSATSQGGPELAKQRIDLLRESMQSLTRGFQRPAWRRNLRSSPIQEWLHKKYAAAQLDPVRTELLAQLMLGRFRRVVALKAQEDKGSFREEIGSLEQKLFPGASPHERLAPTEEERRRLSQLKTIRLHMHNFHRTLTHFPGADQLGRGQPRGLSWRVHLLALVSQSQQLYKQFKPDEPWDSPHNRRLVSQMPEIYKTPGVTEPGMTAIHVFVGEGTPFGGQDPPWSPSGFEQDLPPKAEITDGPQNTLGCVIAGPETATEWTRPGGVEFDPNAGIRVLGTPPSKRGFPVAFLNGLTTFLPADIPAEQFSRFVMHQDGKPADPNEFLGGVDLEVKPPWPFSDRKGVGAAEKMKSIDVAMHDHFDKYKRFPTAFASAYGPPGLSWRVHILPFLGEEDLHSQFNLEEPWDSPHNIKLVDRMPDVYRLHGIDENRTVFHVFVGESTPLGQEKRYQGPVDAYTIIAVMGTPETAAEWTKPGGIEFDPAEPFRHLAKVDGGYPVLIINPHRLRHGPRLLSAEASAETVENLVKVRSIHRDAQPGGTVLTQWE